MLLRIDRGGWKTSVVLQKHYLHGFKKNDRAIVKKLQENHNKKSKEQGLKKQTKSTLPASNQQILEQVMQNPDLLKQIKDLAESLEI